MKLKHAAAMMLPFVSLALAGGAAAAEPAAAPAAESTATPAAAVAPVAARPAPEVAPVPPTAAPEAAAEAKPDQVRDTAKGFNLRDSYFWVDTGAMKRSNEQAGAPSADVAYMGGRFVLAASYYGEVGAFFAHARAELVALESEFAGFQPRTQDAYVMVGQRNWDIQIGRFWAWQTYNRGRGMELYTADEAGAFGAPAMYWGQMAEGYLNGAGQLAAHYFPLDFLGFEVASVFGQESGQNNTGLRPSVDFQFGGLRLIGGFEYLRQFAQTDDVKVDVTSKGYAGTVSYSFPLAGQSFGQGRQFPRKANPMNLPEPDAVTLSLSAANSDIEYINIEGNIDGANTKNTTTFGGTLDFDLWKNALCFGYHRTTMTNHENELNTQDQLFVAYVVHLPVKGVIAKAVYGYSLADIQDVDANATYKNRMHSFRIRLGYEFQ